MAGMQSNNEYSKDAVNRINNVSELTQHEFITFREFKTFKIIMITSHRMKIIKSTKYRFTLLSNVVFRFQIVRLRDHLVVIFGCVKSFKYFFFLNQLRTEKNMSSRQPQHAELLRSTPSLVLCCAWLVTTTLHVHCSLGQLSPLSTSGDDK